VCLIGAGYSGEKAQFTNIHPRAAVSRRSFSYSIWWEIIDECRRRT
jgi:hypothetical protein